MLTKVEVVTSRGTTLALPFEDVSAGFVVKDIGGIDPVKATIVSSPFASRAGSQRQASRRENRNLTMKLGLQPNYAETSVQELRELLYDYLSPTEQVTLRFYRDDVHFVNIAAEVESCEAPPFSRDPEADVVLVGFDPDFVAPASVVVLGNTVTDSTEQTINYPGTVPTGVIFRMMVNRSITEFTLYNRTPKGDMLSMDFNGPLLAGDLLEISTIPGSKGAHVTRDGTEVSVLYALDPMADWIELSRGANNLRVLAEGAPIPTSIEYIARYGGL